MRLLVALPVLQLFVVLGHADFQVLGLVSYTKQEVTLYFPNARYSLYFIMGSWTLGTVYTISLSHNRNNAHNQLYMYN